MDVKTMKYAQLCILLTLNEDHKSFMRVMDDKAAYL